MSVQSQIERITEEVSGQKDLIQQIKTALADKAAGGVELPTLENPGSASDLAEGMELIDTEGKKVTGTVPVETGLVFPLDGTEPVYAAIGYSDGGCGIMVNGQNDVFLYRPSGLMAGVVLVRLPQTEMYQFGDATEADVVAGKTFTSSAGVKKEGTATLGITPSGTINITDNGTYDVTNYESVNVNVPKGTVLPTGAIAVQIVTGAQTSQQIGSGYSMSITYGDAVEISDSIALAFVGTTQSLTSISDSTNFSVLQGKYVRSGSGTSAKYYYIPSGSTFTVGGSNYSKTLTCDKAQAVSMQKVSL